MFRGFFQTGEPLIWRAGSFRILTGRSGLPMMRTRIPAECWIRLRLSALFTKPIPTTQMMYADMSQTISPSEISGRNMYLLSQR